MNWKLIVLILVLAAVAGGLIWWVEKTTSADPMLPDQITRSADAINIPASARKLDDFAYVDESGVYLRAAVGTSTVKVPDADPGTFHALAPLAEYANTEIMDFCKGAGRYGFYADKSKVYMFQAWKTPTFSKTRIEVIQDTSPSTFSISGPQSFMNGDTALRLGYEFGTTTCMYSLEGA